MTENKAEIAGTVKSERSINTRKGAARGQGELERCNDGEKFNLHRRPGGFRGKSEELERNEREKRGRDVGGAAEIRPGVDRTSGERERRRMDRSPKF